MNNVTHRRRRELKRVGIMAARDARALLADAIPMLEASGADIEQARGVLDPLANAIALLFRTEIGEPEDVRDRLREAAIVIGRVLEALNATDAESGLDVVGPFVARSLAILHPIRVELESELSRDVSVISAGPKTSPAPRFPGREQLPTHERRSTPRVRINAEIGGHSHSHFFRGRVGDVSSGGIFVATTEPLAVGTDLTLSLVLPDGEQVIVDGTVAWVRGPNAGVEGMGIRFTALGSGTRAALERFLE